MPDYTDAIDSMVFGLYQSLGIPKEVYEGGIYASQLHTQLHTDFIADRTKFAKKVDEWIRAKFPFKKETFYYLFPLGKKAFIVTDVPVSISFKE